MTIKTAPDLRRIARPYYSEIGHRTDCKVIHSMCPETACCNCYELSRRIPDTPNTLETVSD